MELGQWVTGSPGQWVIFHVRVTGSPGHHFHPVWDPSFTGYRKKPKMQNVQLKCCNDKSHCQVSVVGLKSPDVSPCNELLLLPMIIKHSLAPLHISRHLKFIIEQGLRVAWFPGHWVTKCDRVPCLMSDKHILGLYWRNRGLCIAEYRA